MHKNQKEFTRFLPGLIVSLVCLVVIAYLIDPSRLVQSLRGADYRYVSLAVGVTFLWFLVRTEAWRTLLKKRASRVNTFFTLCEGYLMNNLLPFRLGEIGRAFLLGRKANLGFWEVLPTIIIERALDLAFGVGVFLVTVPFVIGADWALQAALGSGIVVAVVLGGLFIAARYREKLEKWLGALQVRFKFLSRLTGTRVAAFLDGLSILANPSLFLQSLGWILLNWCLGFLQFYFFILAFLPQGKPLWAAFLLGAVALGVSAPATPGSLGVYELVVVSALSLFDANPSQAAAVAFTAHALQYLISGILGGIGLFRDGESLSGLYSKVRSLR